MPGFDPSRPPLQERAQGKMSATQYVKAIKKFGLSQVRAARFLGLSDRQGQRMAKGEIKIPPAIAYALTLMIQHGVSPGDLDPRFQDTD